MQNINLVPRLFLRGRKDPGRSWSRGPKEIDSLRGSLLAGRCQAEAARNGLRPLLVKSRFTRTERTQNFDWSEVPLELISYKYLTRNDISQCNFKAGIQYISGV
jgi:hypothetical protein